MTKWSDKYKKSIDCSNPKGFSQKAHCAGRKKKMNEAGRPYSKTYLKLLMKAGQGKTADTVNVKIPKSGHFMYLRMKMHQSTQLAVVISQV